MMQAVNGAGSDAYREAGSQSHIGSLFAGASVRVTRSQRAAPGAVTLPAVTTREASGRCKSTISELLSTASTRAVYDVQQAAAARLSLRGAARHAPCCDALVAQPRRPAASTSGASSLPTDSIGAGAAPTDAALTDAAAPRLTTAEAPSLVPATTSHPYSDIHASFIPLLDASEARGWKCPKDLVGGLPVVARALTVANLRFGLPEEAPTLTSSVFAALGTLRNARGDAFITRRLGVFITELLGPGGRVGVKADSATYAVTAIM